MGIGHVAVGFAAKRAVPEVSLALLIFAALFADVLFLFKRDRKGALVVGLVLLSHWVLDAVSHGPDMPVFLHGPYLGLGLWNSVAGTIVVEEAMLLGGMLVYLRATRARSRAGNIGLFIFVGVLALLALGYLGPPPPSITPVAVSNLLLPLVLIPVAYAVDRSRVTVSA